MPESRLAATALVAGVGCCVGTAVASVGFGWFALVSLARFGVVSVVSLVLVVGGAWIIDQLRRPPGRALESVAPVEGSE